MTPDILRIDTHAETLIKSSPHVRPRRLAIKINAGHLILQGEVDSYFEKQMAQEVVRRIDGVELVDNRLSVCCS